MDPFFGEQERMERQMREDMERIAAQERRMKEAQARTFGHASVVLEEVEREIRSLEAQLGPDQSLGAYVSPGRIMVVGTIRYRDPSLIIIDGWDRTTQERMTVLQHLSQLSLIFEAVDLAPDQERKAIGFLLGDGAA